eukprot:CAMPEP_0179079154 /NCGR_PEP_ID=MMETSP0796-20121207/35497_1 /TAXON_ID=73915 /ORGANISM="Pyrodinium bahamense, Strain pbaha01" /LENGTH=62 /DNA_ID=CAMNT_0020776483 /DNA_START=232 /DNA_END=420 /DNA_ORIENTATION=-
MWITRLVGNPSFIVQDGIQSDHAVSVDMLSFFAFSLNDPMAAMQLAGVEAALCRRTDKAQTN